MRGHAPRSEGSKVAVISLSYITGFNINTKLAIASFGDVIQMTFGLATKKGWSSHINWGLPQVYTIIDYSNISRGVLKRVVIIRRGANWHYRFLSCVHKIQYYYESYDNEVMLLYTQEDNVLPN